MRETIVVAACALALAGGTSSAASPSEPCGVVVVPSGLGMAAVPGTAATFHPVLMSESLYEQQLSQMLYVPLLWYRGVDEIDRSKSLASAVAFNADDTVVTVTLRRWTWSDGVPITADDVLYTWTMIRTLGHAFSNDGIGGVPENIADITAPDPHTVVITLRHRVNPDWFEALGLAQLTPIPRHAWSRDTIAEQQSLQSTASFYDVVDGPFRLVSLHLGRYAIFVPNARYGGHRASIARLVVDFLPGTNPLQALQAHEVDAANVPADLVGAASRLPGFRRIQLGPVEHYNVIVPNIANRTKPFLADVRFRQAMARAISQDRIIALVFHGHGRPQHGDLSPAEDRFLPPDLRDGRSPMSYDPDAARALLDAAGYRPGPDGIRERNGVRLAITILLTAGNDEGLMIDQLVAADLRKVGIALAIRQVEFNQLYAKMLGPSDGWDAMGLGFSGGDYPDGTGSYLSTSAENVSHYRSAAMDRLIEAASSQPGLGAIFAMERAIIEQQPMVFMAGGWPTLLVRPGLDHVRDMVAPNGRWLPENLTLSGPMSCEAPHA